MEASFKIELPTISQDKNGKEHVKGVLYDVNFIKNKNIKDWSENGGKEVRNKCAIFSGEPNDRPIVFAISKSDLVDKLVKLGVIDILN